eukprot:1192307-Prorocentrum_minimum.AAC.3
MPPTTYYYINKLNPHTVKQDDYTYMSDGDDKCVVKIDEQKGFIKYSKDESEVKELARKHCEVAKEDTSNVHGTYPKDKYQCYEYLATQKAENRLDSFSRDCFRR